MICIGSAYEECTEPAHYVRHTQFTGSHPFCKRHAEQEKDFLKEDSYTSWEKIEK